MEAHDLGFDIQPQPDDITCGPTCLHAIYRHLGHDVPFRQIQAAVPVLDDGGTLGVHLANHALTLGYAVTSYTWNVQVFDPSWFAGGSQAIQEGLSAQSRVKSDPRLQSETDAYLRFLDLGGRIRMEDLEPGLLRRYLRRGLPILAGLSSTFLYRAPRERPEDDEEDPIRGQPVGHFVVLSGYVPRRAEVMVSDPQHPNPLSAVHTYAVPIQRVVAAIYLGVLTHDANLIVIEPTTRCSSP